MFGVGVGLNTTGVGAFGSTNTAGGLGGGLFGAPGAGTISTTTPTGGGSLFGNAMAQTPSTFGSPTSALQTEPTSHGIVYQERLEKSTSTHGKVVSFLNQLTDRVTPPFRYRCNDYLNPNGRPNAGAMLTNNLGGLFGQSTNTASGNQNAAGGLFGSNVTQPAATTGGGLFGNTSSTGLFGQQTGGGNLFGNSSPTQPQANTTGGLFGSTNTGQPTQTSFFGNPTATNTMGTGLLGTTTTQPQIGGGLFGSTQQSTGGGLFGSTQNSTLGGGGLFGSSTNTATTTTQPTSSLFGSTTAQPTNTLGGGLFGTSSVTNTTQPTTGGLFGSTTTGTGGLFGNTTTNTGTGLFGTAQPATTTSTNLFGQPSSLTTPNTGGLFGSTNSFMNTNTQQTTTQPTGGLFGTSTTNAAPTTSSLFGAPSNTTTTTGGLFGSPQTQTTGGLFGQPATTNTTGGGLFGNTSTTTGQTGGLFGNTTAQTTGGGLFGSTATQQPTLGGGLFGTNTNTQPTTTNTGGGLFGSSVPSTGTGLFGSTTTTQPSTLGTGLFGSATTTQPTLGGGGLFGSTTTNTNPTTNMFGGTSNMGLFGQKPVINQQGASVFGLNSQSAPIGTVPAAVNPPLGTVMKDDPYNMSSIAITNAASLLYGSTALSLPVQPFEACKNVYRNARANKTSYLSAYLNEPSATNSTNEKSKNRDSSRSNTLTSGKDLLPLTNSIGTDETQQANRRRKPSTQDNLFIPVGASEPLISGTLTNWNTNDPSRFNSNQKTTESHNDSPMSKDDHVGVVDLPIFTRTDYTCWPSLETMSTYTDEKLSQVEDLTITREGYGSVTWPGRTDVRGLNFDAVVHIESRAVEVYGPRWQEIIEEQTGTTPVVPPQGQGLNKRAIITLENCGANKMLKSKDKDQFEDHKKKLCEYTENVMKAKFISLSRDWTWKFRVEHFSRYAYPDLDPGSAVRKPSKRRGSRREGIMISKSRRPSTLRDTCKNIAKHQISYAIQRSMVVSAPEVVRISAPQRKLSRTTLWSIIEASRGADNDEVNHYTAPAQGPPFDVDWLSDILKPANERIDPMTIGKCLKEIPAAEPEDAYSLLKFVGSIWSAELDVLDGVVQWLFFRNAADYEIREAQQKNVDIIIDLLLANRTRDAAMHCLTQWKKPRLALLISAAGSPNLSAQPRVADQLIAYRKQQLQIKNVDVAKLMYLISGSIITDGEESLAYKSWQQALTAILIFEMNANLIRLNYPTYADQIRLLRCALDKVLTVYPPSNDKDWTSEPEWRALCFLVTQGSVTNDSDAIMPSAEASPTVSAGAAGEADNAIIASSANAFEQDYSSVTAVSRWLLILYNVYNDDPERSLVQALQSTAPWIPDSLDKEKSTLVWSLIRYQQTRNKNFLTRQIFIEFTKSTNESTSPPTTQPVGEDSKMPIVECPSILNGEFLPQWFVYLNVGEEFQRRKMNLQAATAYLQAYKASLKLNGEVASTDSGWWAVLQEQFFAPNKASVIPQESQFMALILQALVGDRYLANMRATIVEALKPPLSAESENSAGPLDLQLIDMLVDLRFIQLVETIHSYARGLRVAKLANCNLDQYEQRFMALWSENDLERMSEILDGLQRFVEYTMLKSAAMDLTTEFRSNERHTLLSRALTNIRESASAASDGHLVDEQLNDKFEVDKYPASLF